jgi:hypothetical protein
MEQTTTKKRIISWSENIIQRVRNGGYYTRLQLVPQSSE